MSLILSITSCFLDFEIGLLQGSQFHFLSYNIFHTIKRSIVLIMSFTFTCILQSPNCIDKVVKFLAGMLHAQWSITDFHTPDISQACLTKPLPHKVPLPPSNDTLGTKFLAHHFSVTPKTHTVVPSSSGSFRHLCASGHPELQVSTLLEFPYHW